MTNLPFFLKRKLSYNNRDLYNPKFILEKSDSIFIIMIVSKGFNVQVP